MKKKKEEERLRILFELVRNARRSDREIARILGASQPTITRKRVQLEREGYLKEYTVIPDLERMGYEIIAFTFLAFGEARPEFMEETLKWSNEQPCIIFAADGEGLGMNRALLSVHRNYASFSRMITSLRQDWQPYIKDIKSFMISVHRPELVVKPFSLKYLEMNR